MSAPDYVGLTRRAADTLGLDPARFREDLRGAADALQAAAPSVDALRRTAAREEDARWLATFGLLLASQRRAARGPEFAEVALAVMERVLVARRSESPAPAVRVARLRAELGRPGADAAWVEAIRCDPLVVWAFGPERGADADLAQAERHVEAGADVALAAFVRAARALERPADGATRRAAHDALARLAAARQGGEAARLVAAASARRGARRRRGPRRRVPRVRRRRGRARGRGAGGRPAPRALDGVSRAGAGRA